MDLQSIISEYGATAKTKLSQAVIGGEPEDQLRAPLETAIHRIAALLERDSSKLALIGEASLADLQTRPDYAVTYGGSLVGFIEVKAPGKGADPRKFKGAHDKGQWKKLQALPNLLYTDGASFSLWRDGELAQDIVSLEGDIYESGEKLRSPSALLPLLDQFLQWNPVAPRRPKQLAEMTARLCRLLRDETREQHALGSEALVGLARDWKDLFPVTADDDFADGFAQSVAFGLLLARARGISFEKGIDHAAKELSDSHSLMGTALRVLTQTTESEQTLATSIATIRRVLAVVDWPTISKGDPSAWLYFYEEFLAEYDPQLRKQTGSYYTPVEVVDSMTRLVDEALQSRLGMSDGLAEPDVTILDPASGTGTFLLSVLRRIADTTAYRFGEGAVPGAVRAAVDRLISFEIQLGPFAVSQLRVLAELADLGVADLPANELQAFVTDTLADPWVEDNRLGQLFEPISASRRAANKVKKDRPIQVVLGNPPYKEKSHGAGGWIEKGDPSAGITAPLEAFMPPKDWKAGAHTKHLYNPYIYFWRWGTWKVFDHHAPEHDHGVVCFITVAGFLGGPGFQGMRAYLRETADAIWVIDCSPEGHQPPVSTRIFQAVQHPVCITMAVRDGSKTAGSLAHVQYRSLAPGNRVAKFKELAGVGLDDEDGWESTAAEARAPFLPPGTAAWQSYAGMDDLFRWSGSGMMPGRTWVIDPDPDTLRARWSTLVNAPADEKPALLMEHKNDRLASTVLRDNLPGFNQRATTTSIADENGRCPEPVEIGYRSFDRQLVIPDKRLINRPNPTLWALRADNQVFLTVPHDRSPTNGPALTISALLPDLHHYNGRGGRAYPMYLDPESKVSNTVPRVLDEWSAALGEPATGEDVACYVAALTAHPDYTARFARDLRTPGLRIPLTRDNTLFERAVAVGRRVLWLHSLGDRFADDTENRPLGPPRASPAPLVTVPIPDDAAHMPDELTYDPQRQVLQVGSGEVSHVTEAMRSYEVSGVNIIDKWFSYRKKNRDRPTIGNKKRSPLENLHSTTWRHAYTADLIDVLNVLALLIEMEPEQADILDLILAGPQMTVQDLEEAGALPVDEALRKPPTLRNTPTQSGVQALIDHPND